MDIAKINMNPGIRFGDARQVISPVKEGGLLQGVNEGGLTVGETSHSIGHLGGCDGVDPSSLEEALRTDDPIGNLVREAFTMVVPPLKLPE